MDFTNRTSRPQQSSAGAPGGDNDPSGVKNTKGDKDGVLKKFRRHTLLNITYLGLLISVTIVIISVLLALFLFEGNREDKFVDTSKHQAVFLDNGQVYFGNITDLNNDYLILGNIYYLRVNQQVQPGQQAGQNDVSLVKLGCELHGPQDIMVINRAQVTFWENLKEDGQVSKAIAEYVKANPDGQDCAQPQQNGSPNTTPSEADTEDNSSSNGDSSTTPSGNSNGNTPSLPNGNNNNNADNEDSSSNDN